MCHEIRDPVGAVSNRGDRGRFLSCYRSAGACPPRSLDRCGNRPQPRDTDVCCSDRCMARDRPSPYGPGGVFFHRSAGALGCHTRIRAGSPRDLSTAAENARNPETPAVCCADRCMARDRPSPYDEGAAFFYRSAGALGCHTRIRAGFPRDLSTSRDRPSPYVKERRFFTATLINL